MAAKLTCPSCNVANPKRISDIVLQQAKAGAKSELPEQYQPPKQPWAYVQGFLLAVPVNTGLILTMTTPGDPEGGGAMADFVSTVAFMTVWGGYGIWKNKAYMKKLDEWKKTIASKFSCHGCKHVFDA